jgi:ABC-2 type transport system permease protein
MSLFLTQLRAEILKLFARKRTFIGFGAFLLLEIVILFLFQTKGVNRFKSLIVQQGEAFEKYYSALTIAHIVLGAAVFLLGGIYLALVAGDIVAKESEDGHMRLLLARPVSRFRLLLVKYLTCALYTVALVQFITWSAFLMGLFIKGWGGGYFAYSPEAGIAAFYDWGEGLRKYTIASLCLSVAMITVSSVAFFLSCLPIKPAAATITALSYVLIDMILRNMGFMEDYRHLLLTHHMASWAKTLAVDPQWAVILRSFTALVGVNTSLFLAGVVVFDSRDLKS